MNNLVAYGDDSDEESPNQQIEEDSPKQSKSPRRRRDSEYYFDAAENESGKSSGSNSDRGDFVEPPPPKRRENDSSPAIRTPMGMPKVTSVSSLVSYSGGDQEEEDNFDKAEMAMEQRNSPSANAEPAPPPRVSQDGQSDEENERLIDQALEESSQALKEMNAEGSATGTPVSQRNDSPSTPMQPEIIEEDISDEIKVPPSPPGECDPDLQAKFEAFFEKKDRGYNFNEVLQNMRSYLNPSCYETFIENYELQEKGTNFKPEIFDPFIFPANCYYDAIAEEQRKNMQKQADPKSKKP